MNQARFEALAEAFGGDPARWPPEAQAQAARWREAHADADAVLAREQDLDARLAAFVVAAPTADLRRRIATRLLSERRPSRRLTGWLAAWAALLGIGALGAGATAGAVMVASTPQPSHLGRMESVYEQSSFGDFGTLDDAAHDGSGA